MSYKDILLYKTETCRNWDERGFCRYGKRCRYAHGNSELRPVTRSNQYKTKTCKAYHEGGSCPYGVRCTFIHYPKDNNGMAQGAEQTPKRLSVAPATGTFKQQNLSSPDKSNHFYAVENPSNIWETKLGLANASYFSHSPEPFYHEVKDDHYTNNCISQQNMVKYIEQDHFPLYGSINASYYH